MVSRRNSGLPRFMVFLLLLLVSGLSRAGVIYTFSTQLTLESGPDSDGLDGATVSFMAEFADDAVWELDEFFLFTVATAESHRWSISGGSAVDGDYISSTGVAQFELLTWQQDFGEHFTGIANFEELFIKQIGLDLAFGSPVRPENFGDLIPLEWLEFYGWDTWQTTDGSRYTYFEDASFFAFEKSEIVAPAALWLFVSGLLALLWTRRHR